MEQKFHTFSLKLFLSYLTPWWKSEEKKVAWLGLFGLITVSLFSVYWAVITTNWYKDFYEALEQKNFDNFIKQGLLFIPILIVLICEFCARSYLNAWLSFRWRRWMTKKLSDRWLFSKSYYKVPLQTHDLDNPDQRISQDVENICYSSMNLFMTFFREGVNFITFAVILWNLSSNLKFSIAGKAIEIPGVLVWAAIGYSIFGIIVTFKVGRPLIELDRTQEKREANFRYRLMRIFERREEIATFSGEKIENKFLSSSFKELTHNYYEILKRKIYINIFQNFYLNGGQFVPLFLVGPLYFASLISLGVLIQIQKIFHEVNDSLSTLVKEYNQIANLVASLQRYVTFYEWVEESEKQKVKFTSSDHLKLTETTLLSPTGEEIWSIPNITLNPGNKKLLMAPSGRGKTTLLRLIAGIYPFYKIDNQTENYIPKHIMFVPQKPYMPIGTMRQCLSYPSEPFTDDILIPIMKECHLEHFVALLDKPQDYQQTLSLGEQQRVNFVRIFLHKPKWLILDEPTAQLNNEFTQDLCHLLTTKLADTAILIITHQQLPFFDEIIRG